MYHRVSHLDTPRTAKRVPRRVNVIVENSKNNDQLLTNLKQEISDINIEKQYLTSRINALVELTEELTYEKSELERMVDESLKINKQEEERIHELREKNKELASKLKQSSEKKVDDFFSKYEQQLPAIPETTRSDESKSFVTQSKPPVRRADSTINMRAAPIGIRRINSVATQQPRQQVQKKQSRQPVTRLVRKSEPSPILQKK